MIFSFVVDWPVDRSADDFDTDLLFALNLLQENVGTCGVLPADADRLELLASIEMSWEFFPPGTAPEVERFFAGRIKRITPELAAVIKERAQPSSRDCDPFATSVAPAASAGTSAPSSPMTSSSSRT